MTEIIIWFFQLVKNIFLLMKDFKFELFGFQTSIFHVILTFFILGILFSLLRLLVEIRLGYDMNMKGNPYIEEKAHLSVLGRKTFVNRSGTYSSYHTLSNKDYKNYVKKGIKKDRIGLDDK